MDSVVDTRTTLRKRWSNLSCCWMYDVLSRCWFLVLLHRTYPAQCFLCFFNEYNTIIMLILIASILLCVRFIFPFSTCLVITIVLNIFNNNNNTKLWSPNGQFAPSNIVYYSAALISLGTNRSLHCVLHVIAISSYALLKYINLSKKSVALIFMSCFKNIY